MRESYPEPGHCLSHVVTQRLADTYASATQATPGTLEGLLTLIVTCEVRYGFPHFIGGQTEGWRGEVAGLP